MELLIESRVNEVNIYSLAHSPIQLLNYFHSFTYNLFHYRHRIQFYVQNLVMVSLKLFIAVWFVWLS